LRAFISLDIVDAVTRSRVKDIEDLLMSTGADLKVVEVENIHFTLAFLGEITETHMGFLCRRLSSAKMPPLTLHLSDVGAFPSMRKPRVIWVGVSRGVEDLERYASSAVKMATESGIAVDVKEGFRPHLTIGRVRSQFGKENLAAKLETLSHVDLGETRTSPARLKRSALTPRGPQYQTICESAT